MIESVEELDLSILRHYSQELDIYYNLNAKDGQSYITHFTCRVDIKEEETIHFINAWDTLMVKFNISSNHHNYILYITQTFYSKLETESEYVNDLTNAGNAIDFFIGFLNETEIAKNKGKYNNANDAIDKKISLQIKSPYSGLPVTLSYPGSARFVVDYLYKSIKAHDVILEPLLNKYKTIPTIDVLIELRDSVQFKLDNPFQYYLIETIKTLQRYCNTYLSKELSRKQHLFIFELLYLFDFLKYIGKANMTDGSNFKLTSEILEKKFIPSVRTKDTDKTAFINMVVKNSARTSRYYKAQNNL